MTKKKAKKAGKTGTHEFIGFSKERKSGNNAGIKREKRGNILIIYYFFFIYLYLQIYVLDVLGFGQIFFAPVKEALGKAYIMAPSECLVSSGTVEIRTVCIYRVSARIVCSIPLPIVPLVAIVFRLTIKGCL